MDDPQRILIIKTGALGDVVRSTSLLRVFAKQEITWITDQNCLPLFERIGLSGFKVWPIQQIPPSIFSENFDLILSLEEDEQSARLAGQLKTTLLTGVYWDDGLAYTKDTANWFDLSLISRLGTNDANRLKWANTASYQQFLFSMIGRTFQGEHYWISPSGAERIPNRIGIESHVGIRWPNKQWPFYLHLRDLLTKQGFEVLWLQKRVALSQYLDDIHSCSLLVSGDTLAMHLALAYQVPAVALFTCTSAAEIYDYGILKKLVSPVLEKYYYSTQFEPLATNAISLDLVFNTVQEHWGKFYPSIS